MYLLYIETEIIKIFMKIKKREKNLPPMDIFFIYLSVLFKIGERHFNLKKENFQKMFDMYIYSQERNADVVR